MSTWIKIAGTQTGKFILGLTGAALKNNAGTVEARNNGDTEFAPVAAADITINNNTSTFGVQLLGSDTQAANYSLTLPIDNGSPDQVLATDGSGVLSWVSAASTASAWKVDTTSFEFGSTSTIVAFTLPIDAVVDSVSVIVDVAFDGTPSLSVGVNGASASQFVASTDMLLTIADRYDVPYQGTASATTLGVELYYAAGSATVGSGRVLVTYAVPA